MHPLNDRVKAVGDDIVEGPVGIEAGGVFFNVGLVDAIAMPRVIVAPYNLVSYSPGVVQGGECSAATGSERGTLRENRVHDPMLCGLLLREPDLIA